MPPHRLGGGGEHLRVKRIELIHPDGSTELVVETQLEGEPTDTVVLRHLELRSRADALLVLE